MIDTSELQHELAQARAARLAAQRAGCEVEELADSLRRSNPVAAMPSTARSRREPLVVVSS